MSTVLLSDFPLTENVFGAVRDRQSWSVIPLYSLGFCEHGDDKQWR